MTKKAHPIAKLTIHQTEKLSGRDYAGLIEWLKRELKGLLQNEPRGARYSSNFWPTKRAN